MAERSTQKTEIETLLLRTQMEDESIQEDIKNIMRVIMSKLQVRKEITSIQWEISNIQMKNQREFIREARSKYEKLRNKPKEVKGMLEEAVTHMSTLEEAMSKLEEAISKQEQEEVQGIREELSSKQEKFYSKRNKVIGIENLLCGETELCYDLSCFKEEVPEELLRFKHELRKVFESKVMEVPEESYASDGMDLLDDFDNKIMKLKDECDRKVTKLEERLESLQMEVNYDLPQYKGDCEADVVQPEQEFSSILDEVRSKQQEVRSILDEVKRKLQIPVTNVFSIKVLCWNIHGSGITDARNCLVPAVVRAESPDILLLQEKTSDVIVKLCRKFKNYGVVKTTPVGEKKLVESLILYDQDKYKLLVQDRVKLFPGGPILGDVMYKIIRKVVPNKTWQLKDGKIQILRNIFYDRMTIVCLKKRDNPKSPIMIFISFHNIYKVDDCHVRESARLFCELVLQIQRQTGCVVVGGADLNHQLSARYRSTLGATLMQYEVTERRSEGLKVDYCIVAPASTAEEGSAKALNFIDTEESDTLHLMMSRLMKETKYKYPVFKKALDHDPLVCELVIYVSEDENVSVSENSESESKGETSEND